MIKIKQKLLWQRIALMIFLKNTIYRDISKKIPQLDAIRKVISSKNLSNFLANTIYSVDNSVSKISKLIIKIIGLKSLFDLLSNTRFSGLLSVLHRALTISARSRAHFLVSEKTKASCTLASLPLFNLLNQPRFINQKRNCVYYATITPQHQYFS